MPAGPKHRVQASTMLLSLQVIACVLHAVPGLVYAPRNGRTTTRIVAYIQDLGPFWVLAFGITALLLGVVMWRHRGVHYGHLACGAVWVMYAVALWIGALVDTPHGTVFYPVITTAVISFHLLLAASYNEDAERSR